MAERMEVYRCAECGVVVEVLFAAEGNPLCCGKSMVQQKENTVDASKEKHVPVLEKIAEGYKVKVGSVPHPMEDSHYIQWIELVADGQIHRQYLKPGDAPEAVFCVLAKYAYPREYCNLHGLWKGV